MNFGESAVEKIEAVLDYLNSLNLYEKTISDIKYLFDGLILTEFMSLVDSQLFNTKDLMASEIVTYNIALTFQNLTKFMENLEKYYENVLNIKFYKQ